MVINKLSNNFVLEPLILILFYYRDQAESFEKGDGDHVKDFHKSLRFFMRDEKNAGGSVCSIGYSRTFAED